VGPIHSSLLECYSVYRMWSGGTSRVVMRMVWNVAAWEADPDGPQHILTCIHLHQFSLFLRMLHSLARRAVQESP
jgi:hypothetical protein